MCEKLRQQSAAETAPGGRASSEAFIGVGAAEDGRPPLSVSKESLALPTHANEALLSSPMEARFRVPEGVWRFQPQKVFINVQTLDSFSFSELFGQMSLLLLR